MKILRSHPSEQTCDHCIDQLDAFIAAQLSQDDFLKSFGDVAMHLDSCVLCSELYSRLYHLAEAEANGALPTPAYYPEFDFSFLGHEEVELSTLRDALTHLSDGFIFQLSTQLNHLFRPSAQSTVRLGKSDGLFGQQLLTIVPPEEEDETFPLSVEAFVDVRDEMHCFVEVNVAPPGKSWPNLGGTAVTLRYDDVLLTAVTNQDGDALFEQIPLNKLEMLTLEGRYAP